MTQKQKKPRITKPGTVRKIVKPPIPQMPEKAEIEVEGADHLYREIRIENVLEDCDGRKVKLKPGAEVDVTIEADEKDTTKQ
jgi:hypothetical protein